MANLLMIIAAGVFGAGIVVGIVIVVSIGIRREEGRFLETQRLREERFFRTGEIEPGYLLESAPDGLTWGARRTTGLWIRRRPSTAAHTSDQDLLIP
jgi:hypothetical protein